MQPVMAQRILSWQAGRQAPPWELMVCPTHRCNLRCGICARSWEGDTAEALLQDLPEERWLRLVDEAAELGARYLNIGGGGEPTLRRQLVLDMCAKAKAHGMEGHLQTNGTTLTYEDLQALTDLRWDYITVSLDGPTAEINDAIRFRNAYAETVKRIQWLVEIRRRARSLLPHLQINMVVTALNFQALEAMVDFCVDNGVELLSVKPLLEYSPDMQTYILSAAQEAALPGYVEKAIVRAGAAGLSHNLDSLLPLPSEQNPRRETRGGETPLASSRCLEPWRGLVVSSSGHVAPCCFFWDGAADNIREKRLEEVWLGLYLTTFRDRMRNNDLPAPCKTCGFPRSQVHRQLVDCVAQAEGEANAGRTGAGAFLAKACNSLRRNGLRGSLERFRQWRAIRSALRREKR